MIFIKWSVPCLLMFAGNCLFPASSNNMTTWRAYRTVIPRFYLEYRIPPNLRSGYGPQRAEIAFSNSAKDDTASPFGDAAYEKTIATYFYGVVDDFKDYDMTVDVFAMKFDVTKRAIKSTDNLAEYVRQTLSKKWVLKGGKEIKDLGEVSTDMLGSFETVVATAADLYHISETTLENRAIVTFQPYQWYFIRLDDEITIGLHFNHFTQKRLTPQWYADAKAMAVSIIQSLKITPQ